MEFRTRSFGYLDKRVGWGKLGINQKNGGELHMKNRNPACALRDWRWSGFYDVHWRMN